MAVFVSPAPGVRLAAIEHEGYTTYRLDAKEPLDRVFLWFVGENLAANAPECEVVAGELTRHLDRQSIVCAKILCVG